MTIDGYYDIDDLFDDLDDEHGCNDMDEDDRRNYDYDRYDADDE